MRGPACGACGTPTEDLDENGECFDCADVPEIDVDDLGLDLEGDMDTEAICYECGNDIGPYDGLCLDCLEELEG